MKLFIVQDKEAGNKIDWFDTRKEAEKELAKYELMDKDDSSWTPGFYEIVVNQGMAVVDVRNLLDRQVAEYKGVITNNEDAETLVFSDNDVVDQYLKQHDIEVDDVDLNSLRDLQRDAVNEIVSLVATN